MNSEIIIESLEGAAQAWDTLLEELSKVVHSRTAA